MRHPATRVLNALVYHPERHLAQTPAALGLDYRDLHMRTADGIDLHGWFVRAEDPRAHILYAHGNAGTIGDRVSIIALLVAAGFDVLAFDYRGFGHSTGAPGEHGTYLDARAARTALLEQPEVDPARVVYLGKSLGGGVLLELAGEYPPAGIILMSTFSGMRDAARSVYPFLPAPLVPDAYPNLRRIAALRAPVLMMHGEHDELLPLRHAERLYAAANEPKQLIVVPGAGHNDVIDTLGPRWPQLIAQWSEFLDR
ncbi:alpha/beta hydrolase [Nocardia rosealba]|uniref:alpha/beta hydrolase n=1 Tax=Nocardia rosealba TaxID=2878563 RepID=UPI001CD96013|nr:alpha/beta hydrolase [Nocardia rosealba]MCA2211085.1 alpha/beta hydrolase [Nocardia rosealba]